MIPGLLGSASGARYPGATVGIEARLGVGIGVGIVARCEGASASAEVGSPGTAASTSATIATTAGSARPLRCCIFLVRQRLGAERLQIDAVGGEDRAVDALQLDDRLIELRLRPELQTACLCEL